jgi:hypothetical protein
LFEVSKEEERIANAPIFFSKAVQTNVIDIKNARTDSVYISLLNACHLKIEIIPVSKSDSIKTLVLTFAGLNEYRYFAASSNSKSRGKDIFRIKRLNNIKWTEPENLGSIINSSEDEDFPFFDEKYETLYFASKGHGSVGGFDIFKSKFDTVKNEWSKPQQLPFPINSPWDDYLYINDSSGATFVSGRECKLGNIKVYHIENPGQCEKIANLKPDERLQECFFKITQKADVKINIEVEKQKVTQSQIATNTNLIVLVSKALEAQKLSDSAMLNARQYRAKLIDEDDKEKRAVIFSEISKYEIKAGKYQMSANDLFAKANEIQFNKTSNIRQSKNNNLSDTSIFSIETSSPYSDENPFPGETVLPEGLIYRIQLGAYIKPVDYDYFGGVQPITAEVVKENKIIKYYAGIFKRFDEADNSLRKIKGLGFKEAFLVAFYNNKKIPVDRAKELEKNE